MQDVAIEKSRKFATDYNVHVSLLVHPRKEDENVKLGISSFYGSAKDTYTGGRYRINLAK